MSKEKALSFSQAIQATQLLMKEIKAQELDEVSIEQKVSSIVQTKNGGRGFFVAYLTSELSLADQPSPGIISALKFSLDQVEELLVKNLAMSSAMTVTHQRNNDLEQVKGSQKVCQRTSNLIQMIEQNSIKQELEKLKLTINDGEGDYQDFLERWQYDDEHKQAIEKAITGVLSK